ncbi:hypothetical protein SETIT_3G206400v2 [Setaria italica]|uniref:Uncharacterized protein n=1 Tax=Setaria italica TaxID=4555 RepID=A0A368QHI4_SETIT|nr:hypothetical protein SETIT_3G206400v2 [Setaria italica]
MIEAFSLSFSCEARGNNRKQMARWRPSRAVEIRNLELKPEQTWKRKTMVRACRPGETGTGSSDRGCSSYRPVNSLPRPCHGAYTCGLFYRLGQRR